MDCFVGGMWGLPVAVGSQCLKPVLPTRTWNVWNVSNLQAQGSLSGQLQARRDVDIVYEKQKKEGKKGEAELRATSSQSTAVPGSLGACWLVHHRSHGLQQQDEFTSGEKSSSSPHWTPNILGPDLLLPGHLEVYFKSPYMPCHSMKNYALVWSVLDKSWVSTSLLITFT